MYADNSGRKFPDPDEIPKLPPPGVEVTIKPGSLKAEVVPENPVLEHAQKLVAKRRNDQHLLTRILLTVATCVGCAGGMATAGVAFALDQSHFGWVSLIGVGSFIVLLWTVLIGVIWLSD